MSKERECEKFLWENQAWMAMLNSNNSGNNEEKLEMKPVGLISNGQMKIDKESTKMVSKKQEQKVKATQINDKRSNGGNCDGSGVAEVKKGKGISINGGDGGSGSIDSGDSDHESHLWTERERRKKMKMMFTNLHALLPQLPPKADKFTIVDEAVTYIKTLEETLQELEKQKQERLQGTATSFNFNPNPSSSIFAPLKLSDSRESFLADQRSFPSNLLIANTTSTTKPSSSHTVPNLVSKQFQTWTSPNVVLNIFGNEAQISICASKKQGLFTTICYILEKYHIEVMCAHVSSDGNRTMHMIQAHLGSQVSGPFKKPIPVEEIYGQAAVDIMSWVTS